MYTYAYPRAALTVDAVVLAFEKNADEVIPFVLLIERAGEPFKGLWALPGGFIEMDELLEAACKRELYEETGIKVDAMQQFRVYDAIGRDPRHRTISVVFTCELEKRQNAIGGDDAAKAVWFPLQSLPQLAFDHARILSDFRKSLNL
ncbi:MAG: NUDIX hydrolase [Draconibacterium sp.]|nr:MAG: NUDIX hydrolase [Draconibacterium sp.]PIF05154.1 MAG: NUDIX hydrolase [Draconibacterium sp.]